MAHDGFLGSFHGLAWPFAHGAAPAPFDALQLQQVVMGGAGAGWEHDSALSSLVSSPSSLAAATTGGAHEAVLMDELASRLGGVCGGLGVPSPPSSRHASCYSTPVSSPSKPAPPVTALLAADTVLGERAAQLPCLPAAGGPSGGKLSRMASSHSLLAEPAPAPAPGGVHLPASDGSSSDGHCRKRKAPAVKAKGKDAVTTAITKSPETGTRGKKCKLSTDAARDEEPIKPAAGEAGHGGNGKGKEADAEPPKDYIHVRARRGQATDSHSLAERVRREKISERMKLLQDLVPGCSKVIGKAVMLDEIINYVQSLQRQVEFLSMKLATVNPRLDFDADNFIPKDANQPTAPAPSSLPPPPPAYSLEDSSPAFCYASSQGTAMQKSVVTYAEGFEMPSSFADHGIPGSSLDGFRSGNSQIGGLWEDDLHSVVQMGFRGST